MNEQEQKVVDRFKSDLGIVVSELDNYSGYLKLGPKGEENRDKALKILSKKLEKLNNAEGKKEIKKIIRLGKLMEKAGKR